MTKSSEPIKIFPAYQIRQKWKRSVGDGKVER